MNSLQSVIGTHIIEILSSHQDFKKKVTHQVYTKEKMERLVLLLVRRVAVL